MNELRSHSSTMLFTPGTSGTLKSTTAEKALAELLFLMFNYQKSQGIETKVSVSVDSTAAQLEYQGILSCGISTDASGKPSIDATEYLTGFSFSNGGGTLKATTAEEGLVELLVKMRQAEDDPAVPNKISLSLDMGAKTVSFSGSLEFSFAINALGLPEIQAADYIPSFQEG